jgi:hypothetical protein
MQHRNNGRESAPANVEIPHSNSWRPAIPTRPSPADNLRIGCNPIEQYVVFHDA